MGANGNSKRVLSPVLLAGAASFAIVTGVSVFKYAVAEQQTSPADAISVETSSTISTAPSVDGSAEPTVSTPPERNSATSESAGVSGNASNTSTSHASVTVNGKTYTASGDQQMHTTTTDNNGQTSIDISVQSSGNAQQYSSSSSNVHMYTNSFNMSQSNGSNTP